MSRTPDWRQWAVIRSKAGPYRAIIRNTTTYDLAVLEGRLIGDRMYGDEAQARAAAVNAYDRRQRQKQAGQVLDVKA